MRSDALDRKMYWLAVISSLVGLVDSVYLIVLKYSDTAAMCLGSGGCASVNESRYSVVYGIPVAAIGVIGYIAILLVLAFEKRIRLPLLTPELMVFGMSLVGVLYSAYLTYLEFYVIHAVCPFCVLSAVTIVIVFIVSIVRLVRNQPEY